MRVAVVSDIHANLPALEAVIRAVDRADVDEIWCLGDAVGYGAQPAECLQLLTERCDVCLSGNHDLAALGAIDLDAFSAHAAVAARWTRQQLGDKGLRLLATLDGTSASREGIGLYHASPRDPVWEYVIDSDLAEDNLNVQPERIALIGHSHIALYFTRIDELARVSSVLAPEGTGLTMKTGKWLVNPGSVGQPRDGDPRAAWAELDTGTMSALFHRTEYDVEAAAEAIRAAGLPANLGDRLTLGR